MFLLKRPHQYQPQGFRGPSGAYGARPLVLLNFGQGPYPRNEGMAPRTDAWTLIGTPTLGVHGSPQGAGIFDSAGAGGVKYGADIEFGRPASSTAAWLGVVYKHAPYVDSGSSVNTIAAYGSGGSGLDGGILLHTNGSNQLRAWLMSMDVTTTWSAEAGRVYHVLIARDANRNAGLWIDGVLIGTGTSSTTTFPGAAAVHLLSDTGLNERRARGSILSYAYGEGDITYAAAALSSNLWALYEPQRIWVPTPPPPSGIPTLGPVTAIEVTSTSARLRVPVTY